jgi:hypothetical protein
MELLTGTQMMSKIRTAAGMDKVKLKIKIRLRQVSQTRNRKFKLIIQRIYEVDVFK